MVHHSLEDHANHENISPARLEAFSDGVFAIIITITILEIKLPTGSDLSVLVPLLPLFGAYAISFQTIGTYWNNHHHLLRTTKHIGTDVMWANLNLLFWLSLIPFGTGWIGENNGGVWPTALYAALLFVAGLAYSTLQWSVVRHSEHREGLIAELTRNKKGLVSLGCYLLAVGAAFVNPLISDALIFVVALFWFVPDRRLSQFING